MFHAILVHRTAIHNALQHIARVVLRTNFAAINRIDILDGAFGIDGNDGWIECEWRRCVHCHQSSQANDARWIILLSKINRARNFRMHLRTAKFFTCHFLTDCCLDQCWSRKIEPTSFGHQQRVAKHGQISSASNTISHDRRVLRNSIRRDHCVIAKNPTEVIRVWKDIFLEWKKNSRTIDEIDQRQSRTLCDFLRTNNFLAGHREKCASLHRRIVCNHHAQAAFDLTDRGHDSCAWRAAILLVHIPSCEKSAFELRRRRIKKQTNPFASRQPTMTMLALDTTRAAALLDLGAEDHKLISCPSQTFGSALHCRRIGGNRD